MFTYFPNIPSSARDKINDIRNGRQYHLAGPSVQYLSRSIETRRDNYKHVSPKEVTAQTAYYSQRPYPEFDIQTDTRLRGSDTNVEPVLRYLQSSPRPSAVNAMTSSMPSMPEFNQNTRFRQQNYTDYSLLKNMIKE